jgi:hypothetical protein
MILKVLQIRKHVQEADNETEHTVVMKSLHTGGELYVCMCKGWAIKTGPCTATFNDLLCYTEGDMVKDYNACPSAKTDEYIHYRDSDKECETTFRKSFCEIKEIEPMWTYCVMCKGRRNYKQGSIIILYSTETTRNSEK